jgi:ABC-type glycerol-3-phosphate transport system substrate-binding protein
VSEAWAWEEFASDARTLQRVAGVQYGWGVFRGWFPVVPFLYQHGGWLLRDGEPDFANAANVEALTWFVKQHTDGIAPTSSWAAGGDPAETLFIRGDCGMVITGNWRVVSFGRQITDFEWGVAPLPRDVRRATNSGGENLVVFNTDRVEGATQLAAFLTAPEQMEHYCTQSMFLPTRRSLLSRELPYQQRPEAMALFAQQSLDFEPAWAQEQSTPQFAALDSALVRQFELATLGHQTPRESLEALNHEYRQALIP